MISLSVSTAKALLKFASSDKNRPNMNGIGITLQGLAATDGFCAVEFTMPPEVLSMNHEKYSGRVIDRKVFETSTKIAAVTKSVLTLNPEHLLAEQLVFPELRSVIPANDMPLLSISKADNKGITLAAQYLSLMSLVADACETESVILTSAEIGRPVRFDIVGPTQSAIVLINQL